MISLQILNSDATLNDFSIRSSIEVAAGEDATVVMRLYDTIKNLRYVPAAGATFSIDLIKTDDTLLNKVPTTHFPLDTSVISFSLTAAETVDLVSQNLIVTITEGTTTTFATLKLGLKISNTSC